MRISAIVPKTDLTYLTKKVQKTCEAICAITSDFFLVGLTHSNDGVDSSFVVSASTTIYHFV
jgi:hypothetical protein